MKAVYTLLIIAGLAACGQNTQTNTEERKNASEIAAVKTIQLNVKGMTCEGCENSIETALTKMNGVVSAEARYNEGIATVSYDSTKVNVELINQAIKEVGYEVIN